LGIEHWHRAGSVRQPVFSGLRPHCKNQLRKSSRTINQMLFRKISVFRVPNARRASGRIARQGLARADRQLAALPRRSSKQQKLNSRHFDC